MRDSDRFKDALRESLGETQKLHPLETLGLTPELVRQLDVQTLVIAARGTARALQMALHPDRSKGSPQKAPQKLQAVLAARDAVVTDPDRVKKSFLELKKTRRKTTVDQYDILKERQTDRNEARRNDAIKLQSEQHYSREAITRVLDANMVLRTKSIFPLGLDLPHNQVIVRNGRATVRAMRYAGGRDLKDTREVASAIDALELPDSGVFGLFPDEATQTLLILSERDKEASLDKCRPFKAVRPLDNSVFTDDFFYTVRGFSSRGSKTGKDSRSLQSYETYGLATDVQLLGCVSEATSKSLQQRAMPADTVNRRGEFYALIAGQPSDEVPKYFQNNFIVSEQLWEQLITGHIAASSGEVLTPQLVAGEVLIAEKVDRQKIQLGIIDFKDAIYL